MIENLRGLHETVNYKADTQIRLYDNDENENYPPHWHTPFEVIMPIYSGYRAICNSELFELREGDVLIICPGTIHELFAPEEGRRIIFQISLAPVELKEMDLLLSLIGSSTLITSENNPGIHKHVQDLMHEIFNEYQASAPYFETSIYSKFMDLLVAFGRNHTELAQQNLEVASNKQKEYLDKITFVCQYINEHFRENLTLEDVASIAGFSKYHFSRLFQQYTDITFYKYLSQKRIAYAKTLLSTNDFSVSEVAIASGYTNITSFTRMFKLVTGCSPSAFQNMYDYCGNEQKKL